MNYSRIESPNHALLRTRSAVTAHAPTTFSPAAFPHGPRLLRVSLSLGSFAKIIFTAINQNKITQPWDTKFT